MKTFKRLQIKTKFAGLVLLCLGCMTSCEEEQDVPTADSSSVTNLISKVETSYVEGAIKMEQPGTTSEKETSMSEENIKAIVEKVRLEAAQLEDRHKNLRTIFGGYDVGVIPSTDSCPTWSEKITIHMDNQDGGNTSAVATTSPLYTNTGSPYDPHYYMPLWKGAFSVNSNGNTSFVFCRVDGRDFGHLTTTNYNYNVSPSGGGYAVLKLGAYNVNGNETVTRYFDNEDSNNLNFYSGDIYPNTSDSNTKLIFNQYVTKANYNSSFPYLGFEYGVIGSIASPLGGSTWYIDDENNSNANWLTLNKNDGTGEQHVPSTLSSIASVASARNTELKIVRVQ